MTYQQKIYNETKEIFKKLQAIILEYWPCEPAILPRTIIGEFLTSSDIDEFNWLRIIISLEIDYKINVPDDLALNTNQTFSEFVTSLSMLMPKTENIPWTFNRIKMLTDVFFQEYLNTA